MASQVPANFPAENELVSKSTMREVFRTIRDEITEQQRQTSLANKIARGDVTFGQELNT